MSVSVIIPAYNEEEWLQRTLYNIFNTATGMIEVIIADYGGNGFITIDERVHVIPFNANLGERIGMNQAVLRATNTHILRIDAHCDFSPVGWDQMMEEVTGPKDMTQAVLTAVDKSWNRLPGHRYERCRLLPNYEAKWEKPNTYPRQVVPFIQPNMSSTGCGFMIRKDFYNEIGGADESYPVMGAIGEEFSVRVWMAGGKVQTCCDTVIGHIFDTGGYDTSGVTEARRRLVEDFGDRYGEIRDKFPDLDWTQDLRPTAHSPEKFRTVTVNREDRTDNKDAEGNLLWECVKRYKYVWLDDGTESHLTDEQIEEKYKSEAVYMGQTMLIRDEYGNMIDQDTGKIVVSEPEPRQRADKRE